VMRSSWSFASIAERPSSIALLQTETLPSRLTPAPGWGRIDALVALFGSPTCLRPHGGPSMNRRAFLGALSGSLLTAPLAAEAQQAGKVYRIGFLRAGPPPRPWVEAFQQGLRARGYIDGRNVVVEHRSTEGSFDELSRLAAELLQFNVDVILASGAPAAFA